METKHTPGPWIIGKIGGTVISENIPEQFKDLKTGHIDSEYYGGFLIAESILTKKDAKLIAAAPDLLDACQSVMESPRGETLSFEVLTKLYDAIKKATE